MDKSSQIANEALNYRLHLFPNLHGVSMPENTGNNEKCDTFQPLYQDQGGSKLEKDEEQKRCLLENACQQGFQNGVAAGEQEACCLVKETFHPLLCDFLNELDHLTQEHDQLSAATAHEVIQLALVIAEKILSESLSITADDFKKEYNQIQDALNQAFHLSLQLNPDDLQAFEYLAPDQWQCPTVIDICTNPSQEKGSVCIQSNAANRDLFEKEMRSALEHAKK